VQYKAITCPRCDSLAIKKNGRSKQNKQRYRCNYCFRQFLTDYTYQGCRPEVRHLIVPMTLNGSGIRDITRVLGVSINTVLKTIKQAAANISEPRPPRRVTDLQVDEMWSFVGKKANQRWLWYGFDAARKQIIAWQTGRRTDATCERLMGKLSGCQVLRYCTDEWESYEKLLPVERHWVGKEATQSIERQNLNFRTHLKRYQRKTICFSKSEPMHDAVTKLYIDHSNQEHHF
jgi:IS1 family transposase/transposase-like protein